VVTGLLVSQAVCLDQWKGYVHLGRPVTLAAIFGLLATGYQLTGAIKELPLTRLDWMR